MKNLPTNYKKVEEVDHATRSGLWEALLNRWWIYHPDKGIMFAGKFPQCNSDEFVAKAILKNAYNDGEHELLFVEAVYIKHDCDRY